MQLGAALIWSNNYIFWCSRRRRLCSRRSSSIFSKGRSTEANNSSQVCHRYSKIPIRWPKSRDEVWKANIPDTDTYLAQEKSDQNWMNVVGERIRFPVGGTHFHSGADKYIASIASMLKFPGDNSTMEEISELYLMWVVGLRVLGLIFCL